jgi:hypothetical protein
MHEAAWSGDGTGRALADAAAAGPASAGDGDAGALLSGAKPDSAGSPAEATVP